jgi:hypothetical protein
VAALALSGCNGATVSGQGLALNASPTTAQTSSSPGFPSTSAAPATSTPATPAGKGVLVTYPAGHFAVVMPSQATERTENGSLGGQSFTVYSAVAVTDGSPTEVGSEDIDEPLDPANYQVTLRAAVGAFEGASGTTITSQTATVFRGYTARRASVTSPDGKPFTLLVFMQSPTRLYILFASDGPIYDQITSTLRLLP